MVLFLIVIYENQNFLEKFKAKNLVSKEEKIVSKEGYKFFTLRDPDFNKVEFYWEDEEILKGSVE